MTSDRQSVTDSHARMIGLPNSMGRTQTDADGPHGNPIFTAPVRLQADPKKPWLNADGSPKTIDQLKLGAKCWSADVWEAYLKTLEYPQAEVLLESGRDIDEVASDRHMRQFVESLRQNEYPELADYIKTIVDSLSLRQRQIVQMHYREDMRLHEIATALGVRIQTVDVHLRRAHESIRARLEGALARGAANRDV